MGHPVGGDAVFGNGYKRLNAKLQIYMERDLRTFRNVFYVQEINHATSPPSQTRLGPFTQEEMLAIIKLLTASNGD